MCRQGFNQQFSCLSLIFSNQINPSKGLSTEENWCENCTKTVYYWNCCSVGENDDNDNFEVDDDEDNDNVERDEEVFDDDVYADRDDDLTTMMMTTMMRMTI